MRQATWTQVLTQPVKDLGHVPAGLCRRLHVLDGVVLLCKGVTLCLCDCTLRFVLLDKIVLAANDNLDDVLGVCVQI